MSTVPDAAAVARPEPGAPARAAAPYMNPYLGGVGLGLVLLAAYVSLVAPGHASANSFFAEYLDGGLGHPLKTWLVFEVLGVLAGGFISGALANRLSRTVEKGPRISVAGRLGFAFAGGALMGIGAKLARGCTSGQALSGGAVLNAGSWAFMMMVFAGAYALAGLMRRQWR